MLTFPIYCTKDQNLSTQSSSAKTDASAGKNKEIPLSEFNKRTPLQSSSNRVNASTDVYGCGANLSGSYGGSGYYLYPAYDLDFTSTSYAAVISVSVTSYDVPNRFTVYNASGSVVASTSWMGYANYPGPWGMSLNTPETQTIHFSKTNTTYTLKVETSTTNTSDSWLASS
ncbi:MAG: hypothetical protein JO072_16230 [Parafilimonas sp.]|nr:hypothetical protein [Parafilimonas sp.]